MHLLSCLVCRGYRRLHDDSDQIDGHVSATLETTLTPIEGSERALSKAHPLAILTLALSTDRTRMWPLACYPPLLSRAFVRPADRVARVLGSRALGRVSSIRDGCLINGIPITPSSPYTPAFSYVDRWRDTSHELTLFYWFCR